MLIRQARIEDLDVIYAIELDNFGLEESISREVLAAHIQKIGSSFLVAEEKGEILGYLEGPIRPERYLVDTSFTAQIEDLPDLDGGYISITSLSVSKTAQGLGVGKALLEAMKELARNQERHGINLTCHDYLTAYYEKHDFINEGISQSAFAGQVWYDMVWENPHLKLS